MNKFLMKEVSESNILSELNQIGFDSSYINKACEKYKYKNIKIFDLTIAQANILKQTALIFGADCGIHKNIITGEINKSDVILCGSISQLKKIAKKLENQPFKLKVLGNEILDFLSEQERVTKLAGILNITPDSFSDGGLYYNPDDAKRHLVELINDGADIIDIGAESTRPGAQPVLSETQIARLKPILEFVNKENISLPISIDTRCSVVADFALDNGAAIINDVSGFEFDHRMPDIITKHNAAAIIQHSKGTPDLMQNNPIYQNVVEEIFLFLRSKIELAQEKGIKEVIIDPGIGFGKSTQDNFMILDRIEEFYSLKTPIMVGLSRKSLLGITEQDNILKDSLSAAVAYPLIKKRVDFLRVHNVKLHKKIIKLVQNIPN